MVRRTKADAEATRHRLLDAAESLFLAKGVSRTSLHDIAVAAGATRGAIYWHFKDKADLFNAMMARATMPMECGFPDIDTPVEQLDAPLDALRQGMRFVLRLIASDEKIRRVFEVATHKVEYNEEMMAVRDRLLLNREVYLARTAQKMSASAQRSGVQLTIPVANASLGLHIVMDGLLQTWLLNPAAFDLEEVGQQVMDTYLRGLGFRLTDLPAPGPSLQATPLLKASQDAKPPAPADSPTQAP